MLSLCLCSAGSTWDGSSSPPTSSKLQPWQLEAELLPLHVCVCASAWMCVFVCAPCTQEHTVSLSFQQSAVLREKKEKSTVSMARCSSSSSPARVFLFVVLVSCPLSDVCCQSKARVCATSYIANYLSGDL